MDWDLSCRDICRLCGYHGEKYEYVDVYGESGEKRSLWKKIKDATRVLVLKDDSLPKTICSSCCDKLSSVCSFQQLCKETQEKFGEVLKLAELSSHTCQEEIFDNGNNLTIQCPYLESCFLSYFPTSNNGDAVLSKTGETSVEIFATLSSAANVETATAIENAVFQGDIGSEVEIQVEPLSVLNNGVHDAVTPGDQDIDALVDSDRYTLQLEHLGTANTGEMTDEVKSFCEFDKVTNLDFTPYQPKELTLPILAVSDSESGAQELPAHLPRNTVQGILSLNKGVTPRLVEISMIKHHGGNDESQRYQSMTIFLNKLKRSVVRVPPSSEVIREVEKLSSHQYRCRICDRIFHWKYQCEYHVRDHIGEKQFHCTCGKSFPAMYALKRHAMIHSNSMSFLCQLCGMSFKTASNLRTHEKTHNSASTKFVCDDCGKVFRYKQSLMFHVKKHVGSFDHVCEICGLPFVSKRDLNLHVKRHRGEKPHKCPTCGMSFLKRSNMKRHTLLHIRDASKKAGKPSQSDILES